MPGVDRVKGAAKQTDFHLQAVGVLVRNETTDGEFYKLPFFWQSTVVIDELRQVAIVDGIFGDSLVATVYVDVEMKLSVQMGGEHATVSANGSYLRTAANDLPKADVDAVQVGIKRLAAEYFACFWLTEGMSHNHHLAPASTSLCRIGYQTQSDGINGVAQIGVAASIAIPILPKMPWGGQAQASGLIVPFAIWLANGKIKTICQWNKSPLSIRGLFRHDYGVGLHAGYCQHQG